MKSWNIKVKSNPQEIIKKLESSLGSGSGSVFTAEQKNDSFLFKFRKRVLYPDQMKQGYSSRSGLKRNY